MAKSCKKVAWFMVETYEQVKQKFSVDEYWHYLITPWELTSWAFNIMRYEAPGAEQLVEILVYEGFRIFWDRLVDNESK